MPIDIKFNGSKIFEIKTFFEYFKIVAYFPIMIVVGTLILWLPIKIFGRIIGYLVYPFEWIASFILGIVYNIISPFFK
jgi:flagellar biosynthesis protein FlhB